MKRYKQILLYVVSTMSSIYNWCDRRHVKCIIKKLIVSVQNFWYALVHNISFSPAVFGKNQYLVKLKLSTINIANIDIIIINTMYMI